MNSFYGGFRSQWRPRTQTLLPHMLLRFPAAQVVPACNLPSLTTLKLEDVMVTPETLKALFRKIPNDIDYLRIRSVTLYRHITPQLPPPKVQEWGSFWKFIKDNMVVKRIESDQPQVVKCTDLGGGPQVVRRSRRHYDRKPYTGSDYARGRGDDIGRIAYCVAYPSWWDWHPRNRTTNERIQHALDHMGIKKYPGRTGVARYHDINFITADERWPWFGEQFFLAQVELIYIWIIKIWRTLQQS